MQLKLFTQYELTKVMRGDRPGYQEKKATELLNDVNNQVKILIRKGYTAERIAGMLGISNNQVIKSIL